MLSQNQVKHITALKVKKYREEFGQFIAEGHKLVTDLAGSDYVITGIYASPAWIVANLPLVKEKKIPVFETLPREMERISALSTPGPVLAVVGIPPSPGELPVPGEGGLWLALDDIRDPGNLGTIIRIADWFGIDRVLCSESCVDLYNPKVVQATMGSIARVKVTRCNLAKMLPGLSGSADAHGRTGVLPVFGAFLEGDAVFSESLPDHGIIVIGNESRGISPELEPFITHRIFIPAFGDPVSGKAESLNASVATAIICAEFRRKKLKIKN
jgi:RNA methyltransferase, TrmH family